MFPSLSPLRLPTAEVLQDGFDLVLVDGFILQSLRSAMKRALSQADLLEMACLKKKT